MGMMKSCNLSKFPDDRKLGGGVDRGGPRQAKRMAMTLQMKYNVKNVRLFTFVEKN